MVCILNDWFACGLFDILVVRYLVYSCSCCWFAYGCGMIADWGLLFLEFYIDTLPFDGL